ncbi:hypothetical protein MKEN_00122500 [Mycena kentingensis (nom. inval.)]|nr:hypothetical protein MKEN_00122500 [Mycena kentingensis (nom. inval.)]
MGRWTNEYQDTVLTAKLKGLVTGAITRAKLEQCESISYKHFVEDLDLGDSFTTSIIDILVQEMAARRIRSNPNDRRLIADQTAKSLRLLSTPLRVYHERRTGRRAMSEFLTAPPEDFEMDLEEDDDVPGPVPAPLPEGIRVNSELFDAYTAGWPSSRRSAAAPTPPLSDDTASPPDMFTMSNTSRLWGGLPPTSSALARHPSIRRLPRRAVDFSDYTAHRRTAAREARLAQATSPGSATDERRERWRLPATDPGLPPSAQRRFFPMSSARRHQTLQWLEPPTLGEPSSSGSTPEADSRVDFFHFPPVFGEEAAVTPSSPAFFTPYSPSSAGGPERRPRLRRGGVRPPESLLFRNESDGEPEQEHTHSEADAVAAGPSTSAVSYPTPGSSVGGENEPEAAA